MNNGALSPKKPMRVKATCRILVLLNIIPAPGWQAAFYDAGSHMLLPVHALALIEWRIYETGTYPARRVQDASPADELREVTGLSYCVGDNDFLVASDQANYCGLLSPDTSLEAFLDAHTCLHAPRQPVCHAAVLAAAGRNN